MHLSIKCNCKQSINCKQSTNIKQNTNGAMAAAAPPRRGKPLAVGGCAAAGAKPQHQKRSVLNYIFIGICELQHHFI